jgi:hypothetical protein
MARVQEQIQIAADDDEDADVSATFCIFVCCTEVLYYKQWNVTVYPCKGNVFEMATVCGTQENVCIGCVGLYIKMGE